MVDKELSGNSKKRLVYSRIKLYDKMTLKIDSDDVDYLEEMYTQFTRRAKNFQFVPAYKAGHWDGYVHMIDQFRATFPYGILLDYIRVHKKQFPHCKLEIDPEVKAIFKGKDIKIKYDLDLPPEITEIRPYQKDCIESAIKYTKGIIRSATASGKSLVIAYIIRNLMREKLVKKSLIIVPTTSLITQFFQDLLDYSFEQKRLGVVFSKRKQWDRDIVISTWQSLSKNHDKLEMFDSVIVDECLDKNTLIKTPNGNKKISTLKKNDQIISYNQNKKIFEFDIISNIFTNLEISKNENMYEIKFDDNSVLKITGNHKILTDFGYKTVEEIAKNINRYNIIEHKAFEMNNRTYKLMLNLNYILSKYNQKLYIENLDKNYVKLSNGIELIGKNEKQKLRRRILSENLYTMNFDILYGTNIERSQTKEKEIRSIIASIGGLECQRKYSIKIRKNLNNGTPWNKGKKLHYDVWSKGKNKHTDERLMKLSINRIGIGNPMYGKTMSDDKRKQKSELMKEKILNGEFTPNIHNSLTHFPYKIDDIKFRSSWEAIFYLLNDNLEYEKIRIPYIFQNQSKIYIVDFVDTINKKLIEIKPKSHHDKKRFMEKKKSAENWCKLNNYDYNIIDESYFFKYKEKIAGIKGYNIIKKKVLDMVKRYENQKNKKNQKTKNSI